MGVYKVLMRYPSDQWPETLEITDDEIIRSWTSKDGTEHVHTIPLSTVVDWGVIHHGRESRKGRRHPLFFKKGFLIEYKLDNVTWSLDWRTREYQELVAELNEKMPRFGWIPPTA